MLQGVFTLDHLEELRESIEGFEGLEWEEEFLRRNYIGSTIPPAPPGFNHVEGISWAAACLEAKMCVFTRPHRFLTTILCSLPSLRQASYTTALEHTTVLTHAMCALNFATLPLQLLRATNSAAT